jgi:hypothetical protein
MTARTGPPGKRTGPDVGVRAGADERLAGGRSVVDTIPRLIRCSRERLDGGVCRTPVARLGLACRWHGGGRDG